MGLRRYIIKCLAPKRPKHRRDIGMIKKGLNVKKIQPIALIRKASLGKRIRKRPSWDEYFLGIAIATSSMSSCLKINTGSVLVKNKRIISTGYNGAFAGFTSCHANRQCRKEKLGFTHQQKNIGICPASHAEINALAEVARKDAKGASLYTVVFPCSYCAKAIAHSGVSRVYYMISYEEPDNQTIEFFRSREIPVELIQLNTPYLQKLHKTLFK